MTNVEGGWAAFVAEVIAVLCAARVNDTAEQFVGGVVDVTREGIVREEIQTPRKTMREVHRSCMVYTGARGRERGQISEEDVDGIWLRIEIVEVIGRASRGGYGAG